MLEVTLKHIALFSAALLFIAIAWYRTKDRRYKVVALLYSLIFFPVFLSLWWVNALLFQHDDAFRAGNCVEAINYAEKAIQHPLYEYIDKVVESIGGFSPKLTFLAGMGVCQYNQQNYEQAIETLSALVSYAKSKDYEVDSVDEYSKLIKKAQAIIDQN